MARAYLPNPPEPVYRRAWMSPAPPQRRGPGRDGTPPDATGPRSAVAAPGPWSGDRGQSFLVGTAVGFAGLAVRARVTVVVVAFAGEFLTAGLLFFAGAAVAGVAFAVTGLAPEFGA